MTPADLLADGFERVNETVHAVLADLSPDQLHFAPGERNNPIGWLVWHLVRVQDDHVTGVAGGEQVYTSGDFETRIGAPYPADATGYGMEPREVGAFRGPRDELRAYADAVHARTLNYVRGLSDADLDTVVDENWDPPVTLGVRLMSVVNDDTQHAGQAAYVRGLLAL